jgi:hypothetical protein
VKLTATILRIETAAVAGAAVVLSALEAARETGATGAPSRP